MIKRFTGYSLLLACLLSVINVAWAAVVDVKSVRLWVAPDYTRLVFDLSATAKASVTAEQNNQRIVIQMPGSRLPAGALKQLNLKDSPISKIELDSKNKKDVRIILHLKNPLTPKSFSLKPNQQYGHRFVVDLLEAQSGQADESADAEAQAEVILAKAAEQAQQSVPQEKNQALANDTEAKTSVKSDKKIESKSLVTTQLPKPVVNDSKTNQAANQPIIIAIDAGHGGEDPGAQGPRGIKEKVVALQIAQKLADIINKTPGYKAILTRKGDYYIELRKRPMIARKAKADLFVSIHADAFTNTAAKGASVFALSEKGSTSEAAKILANRENSADLIGGVGSVSLDDKDEVLAGVLLDLSSTASLSASLKAGERILKSMGSLTTLHSKQVEQASFVVLKSPDMPSILVETGFISNHNEAQKLSTADYQRAMAKAIQKGIVQHFVANPPASVKLATSKAD